MMSSLLGDQKELLRPSPADRIELRNAARTIQKELGAAIKKNKIPASLFIGGSFARDTLVRKERYDIDIFIRLKTLEPAILTRLERILMQIAKKKGLTYKRIHGSRDYFQLIRSTSPVTLEIIPVCAIRTPGQALNVTDLSYFHVGYVKKHIGTKHDEVRLAKQFCRAQGVYGAESYIRGFSGYGLECLIIHFKRFETMLRALSKVDEKLVIDPAKQYKTKQEALLSLNEAKTQSPIVLVDPTYKERNVLAALSEECFTTFQQAARRFLAHPHARFFQERAFDLEQFKSQAARANLTIYTLELISDRQAGDVAGTKLKKSSQHILQRIARTFDIKHSHFMYDGAQRATLYLAAQKRESIERAGPPLSLEPAVAAFKHAHRSTFVRKGRVWTRVSPHESLKDIIRELTHNKEHLHNRGLVSLKLV